MRQVIKICETNGNDGFVMINLYPLRATKPNDLPKDMDEKIHKENLDKISGILKKYPNSEILACWGNLIEKRPYLKICLKDIIALCKNRSFKCLSLTQKSHPKHPLSQVYSKGNHKMIDFDKTEYLKKF